MNTLVLIVVVMLILPIKCENKNCTLTLSPHVIVVVISERELFSIQLNGTFDRPVNVSFDVSHNGVVEIIPNHIVFDPNIGITNTVAAVIGSSPGHIEVLASATPKKAVDTRTAFIRIVVAISHQLIFISHAIGWCYFFLWSISFYLQIYLNFRRKSVVGLNFDYVSINIVGYVLYSIFNIGLYFVPAVQAEYFHRNPRGLIPVQLNDVFFATHGTFATSIIIYQCLTYERGKQRISLFGRLFTSLFVFAAIVFMILAGVNIVHWLDFLYVCSYIKLLVTITKYIPQAYMNYRRKSTTGWCIGNVLLDFSGGILSMLEMILNAYNYDDWASIFGDPTKFGLGLFSVMFDIVFMFQHYVFYSDSKDLKQALISSDVLERINDERKNY